MRTLHVGLRVDDLDRSLAFYTGLGYEVVGTVPETPIGHLSMLKLPDDPFITIELVHAPDRRMDAATSTLNHLVVQVTSLRSFVADLARRGIEVDEPSSPDGNDDFLTAELADPDGNTIELVQWPPGHADGMTAADFVG